MRATRKRLFYGLFFPSRRRSLSKLEFVITAVRHDNALSHDIHSNGNDFRSPPNFFRHHTSCPPCMRGGGTRCRFTGPWADWPYSMIFRCQRSTIKRCHCRGTVGPAACDLFFGHRVPAGTSLWTAFGKDVVSIRQPRCAIHRHQQQSPRFDGRIESVCQATWHHVSDCQGL